MKKIAYIFTGFGLGAGLMYLLDPDRGKRRRALIRDRALHASKVANREVNRRINDLRNRAYGVAKQTESLFRTQEVSDGQLTGQIRSKLGRLTSHPHDVRTDVENGRVTLSGPIVGGEVSHLVSEITSIPGVVEVEDKLDVR